MDIDSVTFLAPVLVLAIVLLLGYAGCSFTPGKAAPLTPTLTFRTRVPTALTVTEVVFAWESSSTPRADVTVTTASGTDGADSLFDHTLADPALEAWTVRCQVQVQGGPIPPPFANGMFTLDGSIEDMVVTFQAAAPSGPMSLTVMYIG